MVHAETCFALTPFYSSWQRRSLSLERRNVFEASRYLALHSSILFAPIPGNFDTDRDRSAVDARTAGLGFPTEGCGAGGASGAWTGRVARRSTVTPAATPIAQTAHSVVDRGGGWPTSPSHLDSIRHRVPPHLSASEAVCEAGAPHPRFGQDAGDEAAVLVVRKRGVDLLVRDVAHEE